MPINTHSDKIKDLLQLPPECDQLLDLVLDNGFFAVSSLAEAIRHLYAAGSVVEASNKWFEVITELQSAILDMSPTQPEVRLLQLIIMRSEMEGISTWMEDGSEAALRAERIVHALCRQIWNEPVDAESPDWQVIIGFYVPSA